MLEYQRVRGASVSYVLLRQIFGDRACVSSPRAQKLVVYAVYAEAQHAAARPSHSIAAASFVVLLSEQRCRCDMQYNSVPIPIPISAIVWLRGCGCG